MFQSFEDTANPAEGPARLASLRQAMRDEGVAAYLVPRADAHQGEYVADRDARLAWLTGFTGSAGFCVALKTLAGRLGEVHPAMIVVAGIFALKFAAF